MAADQRRLGLQPARPDHRRERRRTRTGVDATTAPGQPDGDAAGVRRRDVHAQSQRRDPGAGRGYRRVDLGTRARDVRGGPQDGRPARQQQPEHRDLRQPDHRHQRRPSPVRPRCRDRHDGLGDPGSRLHEGPRHPGRRADHCGRQGRFRAKLSAVRRTPRLRHRGPRRRDRQGSLAAAVDSRGRRARRRVLGRYAVRKAQPRRLLDGAELRPRTRPRLRGYVRDGADSQVPAAGVGQGVSLPQLHPGAGRRHGRDPLVLPTPGRPLGPGSSVRAHAARHRSGTGPRGRAVDQPPHQAGGRPAKS